MARNPAMKLANCVSLPQTAKCVNMFQASVQAEIVCLILNVFFHCKHRKQKVRIILLHAKAYTGVISRSLLVVHRNATATAMPQFGPAMAFPATVQSLQAVHANDQYDLCPMFGKALQKPVESKTRTHCGPVGSRRRTAGRRGGPKLVRTGRHRVDPARRQPFLLLSSESKTLSWTTLRKHEQMKSYVNRWRNEISG